MLRGNIRENKPLPMQRGGLSPAMAAKIHNRFDIEVINSVTGEVRQRACAVNVILDNWWIYPMATPTYIYYGNGEGVPSSSDTGLFSRIGYASCSLKATDNSHFHEGWISRTYYCQLSETTAVGETITEVGLGKVISSSRAGVVTHAMLADMNGNNISIEKSDTDIINIYATVFVHFNLEGYADGSIRFVYGSAYLHALAGGTISSSPGISLSAKPHAAYSNSGGYNLSYGTSTNTSERKYVFTANRVAYNSCNLSGGIFGFWLCTDSSAYSSYVQSLLVLPQGTSRITGETLGTGDGSTKNFATEFDFPENAIVYVDGVEQSSGVEVFPDTKSNYNAWAYFICIDPNSKPGKEVILQQDRSTYYGTKCGDSFYFWHVMSRVGLATIKIDYTGPAEIAVSDDLETWAVLGTVQSGSLDVPEEYRHYPYIRLTRSSDDAFITGTRYNSNGYSVRFDTPPASGAVITIDYDTPMIPKNSSKVMDLSITLEYGPYTGEEA